MKRKIVIITAAAALSFLMPLSSASVLADEYTETENTEEPASGNTAGEAVVVETEENSGASNEETPAAKSAGWELDDTGYKYYSEDGYYVTDGFREINGKTYYFDENGYMKTGWVLSDKHYYYMDKSGAMLSGKWIKENDKWYYLHKDGTMAKEEWVAIGEYWCWCGTDGAMARSQWLEYNGSSYYLQEDGIMATDTVVEGYRINSEGLIDNISVSFEHSLKGGKEHAVITGTDSEGNVVWKHVTGSYEISDRENVTALGTNENTYYYVQNGTIVALRVNDGHIEWMNSDFGGKIAADGFAFGSQAIYLAGTSGPDFYAISYLGKTIRSIDSVADGATDARSVTTEGDYVYLKATDGSGAEASFRIYLANYSVTQISGD